MQVSTVIEERYVRQVFARMQFRDCPTGHRDKLDRSPARGSFGEKRDATAKEVMHKSRIIRNNFVQYVKQR